ncbi:hypothetical protein JCM10908_000038 [Rhodotorula pacifica]|uniref:uncharacterized protein n=1 Tax=Rhodotorula pacifica TaxID=1495444 RepID=UPI003181E5EE
MMLLTRAAIVATVCAGTALAYSAETAQNVARALHGVAGGHELGRRDLAEDLQAAQSTAMGLAQSAGAAVAGGGKCSDECADWVSTMSGCLLASSVTESAQCVCAKSAVSQMGTCGDCLGGDDSKGAGALSNLCNEYASQIGGGSSNSSSSSEMSSSSSSASPQALSSGHTSSGHSSATSGTAQPTGNATNSSQPEATSAPSSGAGKLALGGSALLVAGAAAVLAF